MGVAGGIMEFLIIGLSQYHTSLAIRKGFLEILPQASVSASHFLCMCVLSKSTLYVTGNLRHSEGRGRGQKYGLRLKNRKVGRVIALYPSEI